MSDHFASEALLLELARKAGKALPAFVEIPPGDDMALLALPSTRLLVAADQLIEGIHFTSDTPLTLVARKAITRNVSDVAAMAGIPLAIRCSRRLRLSALSCAERARLAVRMSVGGRRHSD